MLGSFETHLARLNVVLVGGDWGIPIAPEAWSTEPAPWGDQYSNFNAGKILLINKLKMQPWLEEGRLLSAPDGYSVEDQPRNHIGYQFDESKEESVAIKIRKSD